MDVTQGNILAKLDAAGQEEFRILCELIVGHQLKGSLAVATAYLNWFNKPRLDFQQKLPIELIAALERGDQRVYLIGEQHTVDGTKYRDWLMDYLRTGDRTFDYLAEVKYPKDQGIFETTLHVTSALLLVYLIIKQCFSKSKAGCPYPQARFHYVDVREEKEPAITLVRYLVSLNPSDRQKVIMDNPYILQLTEEHSSISKSVEAFDRRRKRNKTEKQLQHCDKNDVINLEAKYRELLRREFYKRGTGSDFVFDVVKKLSSIAMGGALDLDMFAVARLVKRSASATCPDALIRRSIIHCGSIHSMNQLQLLKSIGFLVVHLEENSDGCTFPHHTPFDWK